MEHAVGRYAQAGFRNPNGVRGARGDLEMTEYPVQTPPAWRPSHPGALLREDVLPALRLTVKDAAEKLGVSRQTLHAILSERSTVTPEMAVRLGKLCGDGAGIWLRMQVAHDLWQAERDLAEAVKAIPTLTEA
jgi:addiction module HigA family antidote